MKTMKKLFLTVLSMSALMVSACSGGTVEPSSSTPAPAPSSSTVPSSSVDPEPESSSEAPEVTITLDKTTATVEVGETVTITAETNVNGVIVWSTSNEDVATVDGGVVTGVSDGYVRITATVEGASATCSVRVEDSDPDPDVPSDPVNPNPDKTALGAVIVAKWKDGELDWDDTTVFDLIANPDNDNEVVGYNLNLKKDQVFFMTIGEGEGIIYRHHGDLKYGGASTSFGSYGSDDNFQALEDGNYTFYIEKNAVDPSVGSVWVEGVKVAPTFAKYTAQFGNGSPIELVEDELDEFDIAGGVIAKLKGHIPMLTAGDAIQFQGGEEKLAPGDENTEGEPHNGNNTTGIYPYYYVHNDAMEADVYLKVYATGYSFWLTGYNAEAATPETPDNPVPVDEDAGYYLVGKVGGQEDWASFNYPFVLNAAAGEGIEEYELLSEVELKVGDKLKVMSSTNAYYPEGYDTELNIQIAGTYQIYFRPAGNSSWTQGGGYFFLYQVDAPEPEPEPEPVTEPTYYLKGSMNAWKESDEYLLIQDEENEHKFYFKGDLHYGDQFKVYGALGDGTWYPTEAIGYKTSEGSALYNGYLQALEGGNLAVVVPGAYFIEIQDDGEGKGIWTHLETEEDVLQLDKLEISLDGAAFVAGEFLKKDNGNLEYDFESEQGTALTKDDVVYFRWQFGTKLALELGNDATKALLELNEDKASVKVLADSPKLNFYLVLGAGSVTLYAAEVFETNVITAELGDYANDNAVVYVWAWEGSGAGAWYAYDAEEGGFELPANLDHLKVVRFASGTETPSWDATIWNQTGNMEIENGILTFVSWDAGFEFRVPNAA